jgi:cytochrome P450
MTSEELLASVALLAAVGQETVSYLLGNTMLLLLRNPGARDRLGGRPELLSTAVEESLRFESPAQLTSRVATERVQLGRRVIEAGDMVVVLLGMANRDPGRFPDPGRFDPARRPNPHLAFGAGPHGCPGAPLARTQARLALTEFLERFPTFAGDPDAARWKPTVVHRGLSSLPILL